MQSLYRLCTFVKGRSFSKTLQQEFNSIKIAYLASPRLVATEKYMRVVAGDFFSSDFRHLFLRFEINDKV